MAPSNTALTRIPLSLPSRAAERVIDSSAVFAAAIERARAEIALRESEEKYCSVAATLRATAEITTEFEILEELELASLN